MTLTAPKPVRAALRAASSRKSSQRITHYVWPAKGCPSALMARLSGLSEVGPVSVLCR